MLRVGVLCLFLAAQGLAYTYPYNPCCQVGQQVAQPSPCCPMVQPPFGQPPIIQPPIVQPPVIQPPIVQPPVIQPPIVQPPIIQPPIVQPPVIQPQIQQPCASLCQGVSTCCGSGPIGMPYSGYGVPGGNLGTAYPYGGMGISYSQAQQVQQPMQQLQQPGQHAGGK